MKKKILIALLLFVLIGGASYDYFIYNKKPTQNRNGVNINNVKTKAPDFKLKDLDGKEISLSDLKGKKVYINFFATWCPPCKEEMPDLEKLYQETKNSDLIILAISGGEDKSTVENFVKENNYNFEVLLDPDGVANMSYNISSIPTSYFIDENGNIVNKRIGLMTLNQMKAYIENIK